MPEKKKMGRPTDSIKEHQLKTRFNKEDYNIILQYCEKFNKNKAEAVRDGVRKLKNDLDK